VACAGVRPLNCGVRLLGVAMSMDLYVFLALGTAPGITQWQAALDAHRLPVQFQAHADLPKHAGFLPIKVDGASTGFYFGLENQRELEASYPEIAAGHLQPGTVFAFSFAHLDECAAAYYSAAALALSFNGVAFDPQESKFLTATDLRNTADTCANEARKHR